MKKKILKFEIYCEKHPLTRHINYKRINFAPCNKSMMAKASFNQFGTISTRD